MQVTEINADGLKREFKVVLASTDIEQKVAARLSEIARTVRMPGFRPGKVPMTVLRKRYGPAVMGEVLERAVSDSSAQAMSERGLRPATQPKIEITAFAEGGDLEYKLAIETLPEIKPMNFAELELERLRPEVPEEEVTKVLERLAQQNKKTVAVDRPAQKGDVVVIDFVGRIDGKEFPGGSAEGHKLELGSGQFIPGFEDQLVGAATGERRDVSVTFPKEYGSEELAGKDATFEVTVKEVQEATPAAIDDSLGEAVGMENLEALKTAVRQRLGQDWADLARQRLKRAVLDRLADAHDFPVPQGMVDIEFQAIWKQLEDERKRAAGAEGGGSEAAAESGGEAPAEAAVESGAGEAQAEETPEEKERKAEYRAIAERRVRLGLLLSEVGRLNNITVSDEEVNRALGEEARRHPGYERQVVEFYRKNPQALANIRAPIFEDKVIDFIVEMAKVNERTVTPDELMRSLDENESETEAEGEAAGEGEAATEKKTRRRTKKA